MVSNNCITDTTRHSTRSAGLVFCIEFESNLQRVKNAFKIKHLCGFGENSRSSTNFQDSEDVGEDLISSLG